MESVDARAKLFHIILTGAMLFFTKSLYANITAVILLFFLLCIYRKAAFAFKMLLLYILLCGLSRLCLTADFPVSDALSFFLFMISRFVPLSALIMIVTRTSGVSQIIQALEKLHLPRVMIIPISVMFRFLPTIRQETSFITDSMRMRNAFSGPEMILKSPVLVMEYLFVPLLMRAVKIAEELAASAVVRGIESPCARTMYAPLCWRIGDTIYLFLILSACSLTILVEKGVIFI
jgi:energy-coupling factor transport system permease protein